MSDILWDTVFDEVHALPGASDDEIAEFTTTVFAPLTSYELEQIYSEQKNPFRRDDPQYSEWKPFDPSKWSIPDRPFPIDYLNLLRWANGAECRSGNRWFQFFPATHPLHGVRAIMLAYQVPEYMAGAVPFAFNGGGTFYLFDMRHAASDGEYPILCAGAGDLGFEQGSYTVEIEKTFLAACQGSTDVDQLRFSS